MNKKQVLSLGCGQPIVYANKNRPEKFKVYSWVGISKVKIDGEWIDVGTYRESSGMMYNRKLDEFDKFSIAL